MKPLKKLVKPGQMDYKSGEESH
jgi:hypothetical protein